jgi:hypothetical protein
MGRWYAPLDPDCPAVKSYHAATDDDEIMRMSGCADEFFDDFESRHRKTCKRCQEFGAANIEAQY